MLDDAIGDLAEADLGVLDREWFARYARSVDELLARVDALTVDVAAEVQRRGHDRASGFFSTKCWVKHHAQVSEPEARGRSQVMRLFVLIPKWAAAAKSGEVGFGQTRLMARVAANPRVHIALAACVGLLLADAIVLPYDEFERRLRDVERSADQTGAETQASRMTRHVMPGCDGDATGRARLGEGGDRPGPPLPAVHRLGA